MKSFSFLFFLFYSFNGFAQDSVIIKSNSILQDSLTVEDAIRYAIENNYGVIISKNAIEIGKINNNWANAGAYPVISATANKTYGLNNLQQKLNNGTEINRNGSVTQNLNAGVNINWRVFDGYRMFATKARLAELEKQGELAFRRTVNETVYDVVVLYYNIVKLKQQLKATAQQMELYRERLNIAEMKFNIGSGAKYEFLQAQVDFNEQKSNQLNILNSIALAKNNLRNLLGKTSDTSYRIADTILINPIPDMATVQTKIQSQNPEVLLANTNLAVLLNTKREINAARYPVITVNGNFNFLRNSNGAGFTLYNQSYGPSASVGVAVPLFNGGLTKKQLQVADVQIQNQNLAIRQLKNNLNTSVTNAYQNYQNALNIISFQQTNLALAAENVFIASQRYKLLNITSVELRQVQINFYNAQNSLFNALLQAKLAEAEINLLVGDISNL